MAYTPGMPQNPIAIFADGTQFEVLRAVDTTKDGLPYLELVLSPFEYTMAMLGLKENELNFQDYKYGTIKRFYALSRRWILSNNPEKPQWLFLCTYHGNDPSITTGDIVQVLDMVRQIENLEKRVKVLEAQNTRLEKENYEMSVRTKEYFETQQSFTKERSMLPVDFGSGSEISTKIKSDK